LKLLKGQEVIEDEEERNYAKIAKQDSSCCVPVNSCLGLGCGNPVALASLREGETVLDLGSGAGFDCFLAAKKVGKQGKIIGVDMTPEMIVNKNRDSDYFH